MRTLDGASLAPTLSNVPNPLKPLLVCFSHLRWSFVRQRPQHLLIRAARSYRVLFLEDPLFAPVDEAYLDVSQGPGAVTVIVPILPEGIDEASEMALRRKLFDEYLEGVNAPISVAWYYSPLALKFSDHLDAEVCVFDCMDELSKFLGAPADLEEFEEKLLRRADVVFAGGRSLYVAKSRRHQNVHFLPSSVDAAHFRQARSWPGVDPHGEVQHPRIGFFGVIDERMDLALLDAMAAARESWQFIMIGPVVKIDPAVLPARANIHWLGQKSYDDLPAYLAHWDVGFMPFAMNEATRYISPTKTPEFLSAGLPVVSTPIADVVTTYGLPGHVEIAATAPEMIEKISDLLVRPREAWLARVDKFLASTSWDMTWEKMIEAIAGQANSELDRNSVFPSAIEIGEAGRV